MFPSDWGDHLSHSKKKQKTFVDNVCTTDLQHVELLSDVRQKIERTIAHSEHTQHAPEIQIEYILSKVPYIQMIENIYGNDKRTIPNIPILTKFYEESLMRQPNSQEQACVMGNMCEARMIDKTAQFTCVELRLPSDPPTPQMCVLCSRCTTQKMFYDMCYLKREIPCLIQRCIKQEAKFTKIDLPLEPEGDYRPHYIQSNKKLDNQLHTIIEMAKTGLIDATTADLEINSYLACASWTGHSKFTPMLKLSVQDTPSEGTLPDIGKYIKNALSNHDSPKHPISATVLQCIPCYKKTERFNKLNLPHSPLKLNILLGTLLGLYQSSSKRPQFPKKVYFYKTIHKILTDTEENQISFLSQHENLVKLSFIEYITRMVKKHFPSEFLFLKTLYDNHFYWERIPLLCDDLRSICVTFQEADAYAHGILEKITRVKHKAYKTTLQIHQVFTCEDVLRALQCPLIANPMSDDYEILSRCFDTPSFLIQYLHKIIQIGYMPEDMKICQQTYPRIYRTFSHLEWFSKTTWNLCVYCLAKKKKIKTDLKFDTINKRIVCSHCSSQSVVKINFLGKFVNILGKNYIFCPVCFDIHESTGTEFPGCKVCPCMIDNQVSKWLLPCSKKGLHCSCQKGPSIQKGYTCEICFDNSNIHLVNRVDVATGLLKTFCFCSKHKPQNQILDQCYNSNHVYKILNQIIHRV